MRFLRGYGTLALCLILLTGLTATGQGQTLLVNGAPADTSIVGTPVHLKYVFSKGAVATGEVWLDLDQDWQVGPSDYLLFQSFSKQDLVEDGNVDDESGPGDGVWESTFYRFFSIAPATYIIRVIEDTDTSSVVLVMKPATGGKVIQGQIQTPQNAEYLLVLALPEMPDSTGFPPPPDSTDFPPPDSSGMNPPSPPADSSGNSPPPLGKLTAQRSDFARQISQILQNHPNPIDCNSMGGAPQDEPFFPFGAITDSTGRFEIALPPFVLTSRWRIFVVDVVGYYNGYLPPAVQEVELVSDTLSLNLAMQQTSSAVRIVLRTYFNLPLTNALGKIADLEVAIVNDMARVMTYRRTTNGGVILPALPGENLIIIKADLRDMYLLPSEVMIVNVNPNDTTSLIIRVLPIDSYISGRVTIDSTNPVGCAHIFAQIDSLPYISHAFTSDSGYYKIGINSYFSPWNIALDRQNLPRGYQPDDDLWIKTAKPGDRDVDFNLVQFDTTGTDPDPEPGPCPDPWNKPSEFAPKIVSVKDIPNDQGLQVRVVWRPSKAEIGTPECEAGYGLEYGVWRRGPAIPDSGSSPSLGKVKAHKVRSFDEAYQLAKQLGAGSSFRIEGQRYLWDFVVSVPGAKLPVYSYVAPTLYDSTANDPGWSFFRVSVHLGMNNLVIFSKPDSGYSVDNLAPVVQNVQVRLVGNGVQLSWETPNSPDVVAAKIYRSDKKGFDLANATLLGVTADNEFFDPNGSEKYYYRIVVEDDAGNVTATDAVPAKVTGIVSRVGSIPEQYVLEQNYPNPFNPSTRITFGLPEMGRVRLDIFDLMGRHIRTLVDADLTAGMYEIVWDGRDSRGQKVATGIYLYKLQAPDALLQKKMILSK